MLVSDVCTADVVCCGPQTSALEAARLMRQKHVGDVVVVGEAEGERVPLGVVTDRDLVLEVLGNGRDAASTPVSSLMGKPVVLARDDEDTSQVVERMSQHGVRRMPVVGRDGSVVGIVTLDDLLRALVNDMDDLLCAATKGYRREQKQRHS